MELVTRVEQILWVLRSVFSRQVAFEWFVLLFWSIVLAEKSAAITSYLNVLGLGEVYYSQALHWFKAQSWSAGRLSQCWGQWLSMHEKAQRIGGKLVYLADTTKVMKTGLKMPGVKKLTQQSQNINKPKKIRGHHFGMVSLLMGQGEARYGVPVAIELHEGVGIQQQLNPSGQLNLAIFYPVHWVLLVGLNAFYEPFERTLVDQMIIQSAQFVQEGSIVVLDAFYAVKHLVRAYRSLSLFIITRVRWNTVAYAPFDWLAQAKGPGRPRLWGSKVRLASLFTEVDSFEWETLTLYGRPTLVRYRTLELHWDTPYELVQFVLTQLPCGKQLIFMTNDLTLTGPQVITAYSWRFKIEVCFRTLVHLLDGFAYRFWLKTLDKIGQWPQSLPLNSLPWTQQYAVLAKIEALERFVTLHALVLGVLQLLALEFPHLLSSACPYWFRTQPQHLYPSEQRVQPTFGRLGSEGIILRERESGEQ